MRFEDVQVEEGVDVFFMEHHFFTHVTSENFRRRIGVVRQVAPIDCESVVVVEYCRKGTDPLLNPPHGNSKGVDEYQPCQKSVVREMRKRLEEGQSSRHVIEAVKGVRNRQQAYNLATTVRRKPVSSTCSCDPWHDIASLHFEHARDPQKTPAVKACFMSGGQVSAVVCNNFDSVKVVGYSNPAHIDTTFGSSAYLTYIGYRNIRLRRVADGKNPFFIGPALIHTKERDAVAFHHFFMNVRLNTEMAPYFVTDECAVLAKAINDVWPDAHHGLGREHLIARFRHRGQELQVPARVIDRMKADVFGPGVMKPLLQADTRDSFERTLSDLEEHWKQFGQPACVFGQWIKVPVQINTRLYNLLSFPQGYSYTPAVYYKGLSLLVLLHMFLLVG